MIFSILSNLTFGGIPYRAINHTYFYEEIRTSLDTCISKWSASSLITVRVFLHPVILAQDFQENFPSILSFNLKLLSDELNMRIPHPHEFTKSLPDLLDNVESSSFLFDLADQFMSRRGHQNSFVILSF